MLTTNWKVLIQITAEAFTESEIKVGKHQKKPSCTLKISSLLKLPRFLSLLTIIQYLHRYFIRLHDFRKQIVYKLFNIIQKNKKKNTRMFTTDEILLLNYIECKLTFKWSSGICVELTSKLTTRLDSCVRVHLKSVKSYSKYVHVRIYRKYINILCIVVCLFMYLYVWKIFTRNGTSYTWSVNKLKIRLDWQRLANWTQPDRTR